MDKRLLQEVAAGSLVEPWHSAIITEAVNRGWLTIPPWNWMPNELRAKQINDAIGYLLKNFPKEYSRAGHIHG